MARLALLVTGASGMRLPLHVLNRLTAEDEVERLHLVVSSGARKVLEHEAHDLPGSAASLPEVADLDRRHAEKVVEERYADLAPLTASGATPLHGPGVPPCLCLKQPKGTSPSRYTTGAWPETVRNIPCRSTPASTPPYCRPFPKNPLSCIRGTDWWTWAAPERPTTTREPA